MSGCWAQDGARWTTGASAGQAEIVLVKDDRGVQRVPDQIQRRVVHGLNHLTRSLTLIIGRVRGLGHGLLLGGGLVRLGGCLLGLRLCLCLCLCRTLGLGLLGLGRLLLLRLGRRLGLGLLLLLRLGGRGCLGPPLLGLG